MNWQSLIVSGVSILTGVGVISVVLLKFRGILKELMEVLAAVVSATSKESEGGSKITPAELKVIIEEAKDIPEAIKAIRRKD